MVRQCGIQITTLSEGSNDLAALGNLQSATLESSRIVTAGLIYMDNPYQRRTVAKVNQLRHGLFGQTSGTPEGSI